MNGSVVLVILFFLSAVPLLVTFPFILRRRPEFRLSAFFLSVGLGLVAVAPAALAQAMLPPLRGGYTSLLTHAFLITAGIEEGSKYLVLRIFRKRLGPSGEGASAGIAASLGFAFFESVAYASSNPLIALLRAATAAPIHAAGGAWIGRASRAPKLMSAKTFGGIFPALVVHGAYDLALFVTGFPIIVPILIAVACLFFVHSVITAAPEDDQS